MHNTNKLNPCNCPAPALSGCQTYLICIPISMTISCARCKTKITRPTKKMAIKAWNKYWGKRGIKRELNT